MANMVLLNLFLLLVLILGIVMIFSKRRVESFLSSGIFPASVDNTILTDSYPMKTPGGFSDSSYSSQWKLFPIWAVGSFEQKTNNVKNWTQPCNGTAAPADICGGLYNSIDVKAPCIPPPPSRNCLRVNYYCY